MKRKALIIGINYKDSPAQLSGCLIDAYNWRSYLIQYRGYEDADITMLIEEDATALNICREIHRLCTTKDAEEIFMTYSGHGSQVLDTSHDEADGKDETLVPYDYLSSGMISDDTLTSYFALVNGHTKAYVVIDACHSGTVIDKVGPNTYLISACQDDETAADLGRGGGAFSSTLLSSLRAGAMLDGSTVLSVAHNLRTSGYSQVPKWTSGKISQ